MEYKQFDVERRGAIPPENVREDIERSFMTEESSGEVDNIPGYVGMTLYAMQEGPSSFVGETDYTEMHEYPVEKSGREILGEVRN